MYIDPPSIAMLPDLRTSCKPVSLNCSGGELPKWVQTMVGGGSPLILQSSRAVRPSTTATVSSLRVKRGWREGHTVSLALQVSSSAKHSGQSAKYPQAFIFSLPLKALEPSKTIGQGKQLAMQLAFPGLEIYE